MGRTLPEGWSTFSIPISASNSLFFAATGLGTDSQDGLVDETKVSIAYRFNAATQTWEQVLSGDTISPLEGLLVKSNAAHAPTLIVSTAQTNPPTMALSSSWNLVGPAAQLSTSTRPVDVALASVLKAPVDLIGYTQVVSPAVNSTAFTWIRGQASPPNLERWHGYWVSMENPDTLVGVSLSTSALVPLTARVASS